MKYAEWPSAALKIWPWYCLAIVLILGDQLTKSLASHYLTYARPHYVAPFFDLMLLHNTGAAFSFLDDAGGWQRWAFSGLSASISVVLIIWLPMQKTKLVRLALSLVLAGALGNLVDRVILGYVVDFVSLHYGGKYFPAFNLADSCISVGAALLILDWFIEPKRAADD